MADIVATVGASGYDYTSLITAESSEQATYGNLVGDGNTMTFEIYGTVDEGGSSCSIDGWTTGASNGITITSGTGEFHKGVSGGGAVYTSDIAFNAVVNIADTYITFRDLEITNPSTGTSTGALKLNTGAGNITVDRCIIKTSGSSNAQCFRCTSQYNDGNLLRNSVFISSGGGVACVEFSSEGTIQNCTLIAGGATNGIRRETSDAITITNTLVVGATSADFNIAGGDSGAAVTMTYCASSDTSATGTGAVTGITSADYNTTYRPLEGQDLWGAGDNLSGTFTTDIRGRTRDVWSIGAYDSDYVIYTLKSTGGDYASISTWESTEQADLTSTGDKHILECYKGTTTDGN